jgi:hypothetical protein
MSEGRHFACTWKKEGELYRVWVKGRPALSATGQTFNQADKRLWTVIIDATGDGESIREYDPPEPTSEPAIVDAPLADMSTWFQRLKKLPRRDKSPREPLDTHEKIQAKFAERVGEHFAFLAELGLRGPEFSHKDNRLTGRSYLARFASPSRTLEIDLTPAFEGYANGSTFDIDRVPGGSQFESFMSTMFIGLRHRDLGNLLAEMELRQTLDEVMQTQFPLYAELFRGELRPLLTGAQWHDEYTFYRDASPRQDSSPLKGKKGKGKRRRG